MIYQRNNLAAIKPNKQTKTKKQKQNLLMSFSITCYEKVPRARNWHFLNTFTNVVNWLYCQLTKISWHSNRGFCKKM